MKKIIHILWLLVIADCSIAQNKSITIDGKANDWSIPLNGYDSQTQIAYSITNDNANLYFCFRAEDIKVQTRLIKLGFQISVDTKGRKSTKNYFSFKPQLNIRDQPEGKPSIEALKTAFKLSPMIVTLKGFASYAKETTIDVRTIKNEAFALDWDSSNVITIEYKVPFAELFFPPDTSSHLSVGLMLYPIELPTGGILPGRGDMGGGPPDASGMRPPPDLQGVNRSTEMGEITQEKKIWIKFKITSL